MPMSPEEQAFFEMPHEEFEAKTLEALEKEPRDYGRLVLMRNVAYAQGTSAYRKPEDREPYMQTWTMIDLELAQGTVQQKA